MARTAGRCMLTRRRQQLMEEAGDHLPITRQRKRVRDSRRTILEKMCKQVDDAVREAMIALDLRPGAEAEAQLRRHIAASWSHDAA